MLVFQFGCSLSVDTRRFRSAEGREPRLGLHGNRPRDSARRSRSERSNGMNESPMPTSGTTSTVPSPSANGSSAPPSTASPSQAAKTGSTRTRLSGMGTGLIASASGLVVKSVSQVRRIVRLDRRRPE